MKASKAAQERWDKIPSEVRMKILNNVWCGNCRKSVNIDVDKMSTDKFGLILNGKCMNCDGPVARVIEKD
ncbi:MAG: hypothetical protein AB8G05_10095 [Oligoflexales bacterium]